MLGMIFVGDEEHIVGVAAARSSDEVTRIQAVTSMSF